MPAGFEGVSTPRKRPITSGSAVRLFRQGCGCNCKMWWIYSVYAHAISWLRAGVSVGLTALRVRLKARTTLQDCDLMHRKRLIPPSVLPDISPSRGEIGRTADACTPSPVDGVLLRTTGQHLERRANHESISPLRGRCPAGQRGVKPRIKTVRRVLTRRSLKNWSSQIFLAPHSATPSHLCFNSLVPQRLHRQACWRCGAGAGVKGKTQNLLVRVRGKWSPSGDTGEMAGLRI